MSTTTATLKPCPWCGGKPRVLKNHNAYRVEHMCDVMINTVWYRSSAAAVETWNKRYTPEASQSDPKPPHGT